MKATSLFLLLSLSTPLLALAQAPADAASAPPGSTGLCRDGTFATATTKKGACAGHKGIKQWFATGAPAAGKSAATPAPADAAPAAAAAAPAAAPAAGTPARAASTKSAKTPVSTTPAAGGGPGKVWVNTSSKVYHCFGTKYYGTTKQGEYLTEEAAKAAGNHADHGKACS